MIWLALVPGTETMLRESRFYTLFSVAAIFVEGIIGVEGAMSHREGQSAEVTLS